MYRTTSYLVCHEHIYQVAIFLKRFIDEKKDCYNHSEWISFEFPDTNFILNLMKGEQQLLTQNFTLEFEYDCIDMLREFASLHEQEVSSFEVNKTVKPYRFHFISIEGPKKICKVEASYSEPIH